MFGGPKSIKEMIQAVWLIRFDFSLEWALVSMNSISGYKFIQIIFFFPLSSTQVWFWVKSIDTDV